MSLGVIAMPKKQEFHHQEDDYACMLLFIASDCHDHFLAIAHKMLMTPSQFDFITIKITVSAKDHLARKEWSIIVLLTLSATQLHVSE